MRAASGSKAVPDSMTNARLSASTTPMMATHLRAGVVGGQRSGQASSCSACRRAGGQGNRAAAHGAVDADVYTAAARITLSPPHDLAPKQALVPAGARLKQTLAAPQAESATR